MKKRKHRHKTEKEIIRGLQSTMRKIEKQGVKINISELRNYLLEEV